MAAIPRAIDFSAGAPIQLSPYPGRLDPAFQNVWLERILPEVAWIATLIWSRGPTRAAKMAATLSSAARHRGQDRYHLFAAASDYAALGEEDQEKVVEVLEEKKQLQAIGTSLLPLCLVFPDLPLRFLCPSVEDDHEAAVRAYAGIEEMLDEFASPVTRSGLLLQGIVLLCAYQAGVLRAGDPTLLKRLGKIAEYPITIESCEVAVKVVEVSTVLLAQTQFFPSGDWPERFWRRVAELT